MKPKPPEKQLAAFLDKYTPEIRARARAALVKMRTRVPGAIEMVYDNYNALVIGFSPSERPSEAIFSIVMYPRYVSLCFLQGAKLSDPKQLLQGSGNQVRHIRLHDAADLDRPDVCTLIAQAIESAAFPLNPSNPRQLIIRSVSAKQRPRRPV